MGSLAECADNKAHLDEQQVCRTLTWTVTRHLSGSGGMGYGGAAGEAAAGAGGMFSAVFAAQSRHSAAVAQWGMSTLTCLTYLPACLH